MGRAGQDPWPGVAATRPHSGAGLIASGCGSGARSQEPGPVPTSQAGNTEAKSLWEKAAPHQRGRIRTRVPASRTAAPEPSLGVQVTPALSIPLGGLWRLTHLKAWGSGAGPMTPTGRVKQRDSTKRGGGREALAPVVDVTSPSPRSRREAV